MGELAENYGFYGSNSFEGSAESLIVGDNNEGWIFHVLPDNTGTKAIWAAQRIPDDHFATVDNMFVIRVIDFDSPDFMYSKNIKQIALDNKLWKEDTPFDFTKI